MKVGLVVSTADALPSAYAVYADDLCRCIDRCAGLGYDGVELALRYASQVDVTQISRASRQPDSRFPASQPVRSLLRIASTLTHPEAEIRDKAVERIINMIRLAAEFGAKVNTGRVRGVIHDGENPKTARQRYIDCIQRCAGVAEPLVSS